jgi:folate-dependent phosphoribosylglycinamide formyltransferase PurN
MAKKQNKTQRIKALLSSRPELTAKEVAEKLGVSANLVHQVKWQSKKQVKRPSKIIEAVQEMKTTLDALDKIKDRPKYRLASAFDDLVNHPPHYKAGGVETIDFIEAKDLNYRLGNVVKYVTRAEKKGNPIEDLKKARWYLDREINARENA